MKARVPIRQTARERERITAKNMRSNDRFLNYAHRSIVLSIRDNAGFGDERMQRLIDGDAADAGSVQRVPGVYAGVHFISGGSRGGKEKHGRERG